MPKLSTPSDECPRCRQRARVRRVSPGLLPSLPLEWSMACNACGHEWIESVELVKNTSPRAPAPGPRQAA
jgi:hypothetical protein